PTDLHRTANSSQRRIHRPSQRRDHHPQPDPQGLDDPPLGQPPGSKTMTYWRKFLVFYSYHGIESTDLPKSLVRIYSCVRQRCVFISPESKNGLVHVIRIENSQRNQQIKVVDRQTSNYFK